MRRTIFVLCIAPLLGFVTAFGVAAQEAANQTDPAAAAGELLAIMERLQGNPAELQAVRDVLVARIATQKQEAAQRDARAKELEQRAADIAAQLDALNEEASSVAEELAQVRGALESGAKVAPVLDQTLALIDAVFGTLPDAGGPVEEAVVAVAPDAPVPVVTDVVAANLDAQERVPPVVLSAEQKVFFEKQVLATLAANCFKCHGPETQKNGLRLDSLAGMLTGGERGPAIVPGNAGESRLAAAIRREGELKMPPETPLDAEAVATLTKWIELGAPWPADVAVPAVETPAPKLEPKPETPAVEATPAVATSGIDFNRDIRPILSNNCYECHGPDERARKAGLRLDIEEGAFGELKSGVRAVVAKDRSASELFRRITAADASDRMPPPESDHLLSAAQIEKLGRWIDEGAPWAGHWSFIPPRNPAMPAVANDAWPKNAIDRFVLARMEKEGLSPSAEADRRTLIRRVTFDLTGLPSARDEVEAFVNDASPDAYEKVVDRLLASPRYGEHMARYWLDLARYADTNGYHIDNERTMWRWRDWVIGAFNENKPFDEFTVEQIAGDLLVEPRLDQLIATGFNRNHMINFEGGAIPEEYRTQYVIDRLDATSTVWMGLTVACAQCHDHKFDPISQREFYQMFAFFNAVPEEGLDGREGNAMPFVKAPLPEQREQMAAFEAEIAAIRSSMDAPMPELDAAQAAWETERGAALRARWAVLAPRELLAKEGATLTRQDDGSILASGENPEKDVYEFVTETNGESITAFRLEALTHASANGAAGRFEEGGFLLTEFEVEMAPKDSPDTFSKVEIALANADYSADEFPVELAIDGINATGWAVDGATRRENRTAIFALGEPMIAPGGAIVRIRLRFESPYPQRTLVRFRLSAAEDDAMTPAQFGPWYVSGPYIAADGNAAYVTAYEPDQGVDLKAAYDDGRGKWVRALPGYEDGIEHKLYGDVAATYLYRKIHANTARTVSLALGTNDAVKVWVNGAVVHDNNVPRGLQRDQDKIDVALNAGDNDLLMKVVNYGNDYAFVFRRTKEQTGDAPLALELALAKLSEERSETEQQTIREFYRRENSDAWRELETQLAKVTADRDALEQAIPTTMIMAEMESPRDTHILMRGQYDQLGEKVDARVPDAFPPLPEGAPRDRLGFAEWLVSPEHPLTARVAMNRYWQQFFGHGIVKTSEDFGAQGQWPTHPDLLDWLATEFVDSGWDVKAMIRSIVTSATYRQDSRSTPALRERDPENQFLARGPRMRLDAEMVRDNALALSGLLVENVGGPSVKPYQPKGIWEEVAYGAGYSAQLFEMDKGDALYRRSMYTFWKRQAPPPQMMLFDAPNRETCTARRGRTNTPLQALALLNDPQYVEAARAFAERALRECNGGPEARIDWAFEIATARKPTEEERAVLLDVLETQLGVYRGSGSAAVELVSVGESEPEAGRDSAELAAWSTVTSMILNLDETITKS